MMRFYRALLFLYPTSFRAEYGDELSNAFAMRRAGNTGLLGVIAGAFSAVADVVPNAIAAHWDVLRQDLRYTLRGLRQSPGFALTAILVVALGVGANTAAFSVADFVLFRPLPFPQPDRLLMLWEQTPGYQMELSPGNYADWKAQRSPSRRWARTSLRGESHRLRRAASHPMARVTHDLFATLGAHPLIAGRLFSASDTVAGHSLVDELRPVADAVRRRYTSSSGKRSSSTARPHDDRHHAAGFHFPNRDIRALAVDAVHHGRLGAEERQLPMSSRD